MVEYQFHSIQRRAKLFVIKISFNMMIRLINRTLRRMSISKSILLNDSTPFGTTETDFPANFLRSVVSDQLNIPYLSKYEGSIEELKRKVKYEGVLVGDPPRVFFSIPTARSDSNDFYYIHYMFHTGWTQTTLTHQARCCLSGKDINDPKVRFVQGSLMKIGGNYVETYLSRPNPGQDHPSHGYHNVNVLGMSFLRKCYKYNQKLDYKEKLAVLEWTSN